MSPNHCVGYTYIRGIGVVSVPFFPLGEQMAFMVGVAKIALGVILARTAMDMFDSLKNFLRKKEQ